jgi:prepilin-type N-terminal cleavage/methylation domain-containing protein
MTFQIPWRSPHSASAVKGFTLPEVLAIVAIIGILLAIAAPSWFGFLETRKLKTAQDGMFQAIRQAQVQSTQTHSAWTASFREPNGLLQYAVHSATDRPTWQSSIPNIHIDPSETTLANNGSAYQIQFSKSGQVRGQLGRLTLISDLTRSRRCVIVSTLLGALRRGQGYDRPDATGRLCY